MKKGEVLGSAQQTSPKGWAIYLRRRRRRCALRVFICVLVLYFLQWLDQTYY